MPALPAGQVMTRPLDRRCSPRQDRGGITRRRPAPVVRSHRVSTGGGAMDARVNKEVVPRGRTHRWWMASLAVGVLMLAALPAPSLARSAPQAKVKATVDGAQTVTW